MAEREPPKLPEKRDHIDMGENADGTHTILPGYISIEGAWIHPDRAHLYLARLEALKKKKP